MRSTVVAAVVLAGGMVVGGAGGAVAGSLVTSADIKDGAVHLTDLGPRGQRAIEATARVRRLERTVAYLERSNDEMRFVALDFCRRAIDQDKATPEACGAILPGN